MAYIFKLENTNSLIVFKLRTLPEIYLGHYFSLKSNVRYTLTVNSDFNFMLRNLYLTAESIDDRDHVGFSFKQGTRLVIRILIKFY